MSSRCPNQRACRKLVPPDVLPARGAAPRRRRSVGERHRRRQRAAADSSRYRPKLAVSETLEPFLKQLEPGSDGVPARARGEGARRAARASCPMRFARAAAAPPASPADCSIRASAARDCSRSTGVGESGAARGEAGDGSAARLHARCARVRRGTAAADRRCPRGHRRGVPHHRHRARGFGRSAVRPPHHRPLRHRRRRHDGVPRRARRRVGDGLARGTRPDGRSFDGRPTSHLVSRARGRSSPRSPRRRSAATTRSAGS